MSNKNTPAAALAKRSRNPETTAYVVILILAMLRTGARTGSKEIQDRLRVENGVNISIRTVQRHLSRLSGLFPIEADNGNPRGYRWATTKQASAMREAAIMMSEAA